MYSALVGHLQIREMARIPLNQRGCAESPSGHFLSLAPAIDDDGDDDRGVAVIMMPTILFRISSIIGMVA